jgi:hypothetical protein
MRAGSRPTEERSPESMSIIEIGRPFVKYAYDNTRCFASRMTGSIVPVQLEPFYKLPSALADPNLDFVICHAPVSSPLSPRWWLRNIGTRRFLRAYLPLTSLISPQILRKSIRAPLAVVDLEDTPFLRRDDLFLLDRADLWFKRELPIDHWKIFMLTDHSSVPTQRYRQIEKHRKRIEKLRPISIGPPIGFDETYPDRPLAKTSDIFFAGLVDGSSTVRGRGIQQVRKLQTEGYRIDLPSGRLDKKEFVRRAASAHLVWSPEGYGNDCFRHYEAPMCWSVPLINRMSIERYAPLQDGVHAVYYEVEGDGLINAAKKALMDREKLSSMASTARQHVVDHHHMRSIVRHVIHETTAANDAIHPKI